LLAVLAGGLGMMNTMMMSVFERTREIGVLRALGWRKLRVMRMILGEAMVLSIAGGLLGNLLGLAMLCAANRIPAIAGIVDDAYSAALAIEAMLVALVLGVLGGLYPAWRASRLPPAEAMRYDGSSTVRGRTGRFARNGSFGDLALRNLMRQRTRTSTTMLAVGVGVALIVVLGGIGDGMMKQLGSMGSGIGDLMIGEAKASDMYRAAIDDKVGRYAASLPGVESVSGLLLGSTAIPGTAFFPVFGMNPTSYGIRHFAVAEGERIRTPRDLLLGKAAAKSLKKRIGDPLRVAGNSYRVAGIFETGVGYEESGAVLSLAEAQRIFRKPNQVSYYGIKLRDPGQADAVRKQIEMRMPQVSVSQSSEFGERSSDMRSFRVMTTVLSLVSILVGGAGMANALLMSVYQRMREIGTLRALGWRRGRVVWMIVREAILLSLLSGLAGVAVGIGLGTLVSFVSSMGAYLKGSYSLALVAQALLVALLLGMLGALYPAWYAANLSPIEALRYE
ncbi:MAG: ABC transporter permease, partial [Chloroflexi bacterium]|nr:ABC transporter permease [Chloroflexota bacterium]